MLPRWLVTLALLLSCAVALCAETPGPVYVVPLKSDVSAAQFYFIRRALKEAERAGASGFVIDMETYGGEVKAAIDHMDALLKTSVPTYTYVNNKALSAGALIALATKQIYMAPTGVIGAAAPVTSTGEDIGEDMKAKTKSALSAMVRAAAQRHGHNPELADAFIDKQKELKIGEAVIDKSDSLLTLSAEEAVKWYDGKTLLAAGVSPSLEAMLQSAKLTGPVVRFEPSGAERLAVWITALAPLLLLGGMIGAYIEFKTPGFGLPGIAAAVCFGLYFTGHYLAGLAGWEVMAFFFVGVLLVLAELLLFPGTLVPGVIGAVLMIGSLVWAMIDRYPKQPWWPTGEMLVTPLLNLGVAIVLAVIAAYFFARFLPKTSLYQKIVLQAETPAGISLSVPAPALDLTAGMTGAARTPLRPSGKALFGDRLVDVVSEGDFIPQGAAVRVVAVEGMRVVVAATAAV